MPLTDAEKEKIHETEVLKGEIRKELSPPEKDTLLSDFGQQLILLCLGFVLTAVVGGALTALYKSREANNQRQYLAQQRALDKNYSLIEKTSKEVATTVAAADDVLAAYYGDDWTSKDIDERRENWTRTSRNWRVNCQVLRAEMGASFSDPSIVKAFDEIIKKRKLMGNAIVNLPREKKAILQDKDLKQELENANNLKNGIAELLYECVALMTTQVKKAGQ
jgi:hypothetical protein